MAKMIALGVESLDDLRPRLEAGEPLALEDGLRLYESHDIFTLGELANSVRERLHGRQAYYNVNLHINYSNYCILRCKFCSFYRPYPKQPSSGDDGGYELSIEEIAARAWAAYARGATEGHIVGGVDSEAPRLDSNGTGGAT